MEICQHALRQRLLRSSVCWRKKAAVLGTQHILHQKRSKSLSVPCAAGRRLAQLQQGAVCRQHGPCSVAHLTCQHGANLITGMALQPVLYARAKHGRPGIADNSQLLGRFLLQESFSAEAWAEGRATHLHLQIVHWQFGPLAAHAKPPSQHKPHHLRAWPAPPRRPRTRTPPPRRPPRPHAARPATPPACASAPAASASPSLPGSRALARWPSCSQVWSSDARTARYWPTLATAARRASSPALHAHPWVSTRAAWCNPLQPRPTTLHAAFSARERMCAPCICSTHTETGYPPLVVSRPEMWTCTPAQHQ